MKTAYVKYHCEILSVKMQMATINEGVNEFISR